MYDIAIIGAGPAGATAARLLAPRYRVLLIDKRRLADSDEDSTAMKCCGGLLAPDAQQMISRLGLGLPRSVLVEPQLFVVRAIDLASRRERYYQRYYINMDRRAFDRWLVSLVPPRVDLAMGWRLTRHERRSGGFRLTLTDGSGERIETARVLIGADGAASTVRRQATAFPPQAPAYVAVQEWVRVERSQPYFSALFDPALTDYYGWTIPKGDQLVIGIALPLKARTARCFETFKERLDSLGFRFGETLHREAALIRRPLKGRHLAAAAGRIAMLGEAGGWISPSSAEGLSYAFRTAVALVEATAPGLAGFERRYCDLTRGLAWNIFTKNLKSRVVFNPSLRAAVLRSGVGAMQLYTPEDVPDEPLTAASAARPPGTRPIGP